MKIFDYTCPTCKKEIEYSWISRQFWSGVWDWKTEFEFNCPHCDVTILVEVESVPEFIFMAKETMKIFGFILAVVGGVMLAIGWFGQYPFGWWWLVTAALIGLGFYAVKEGRNEYKRRSTRGRNTRKISHGRWANG